MNLFKIFSDFIGVVLLALLLLALIIFLCSCKPQASMYHIYLEHDPREPLYSTSSLKDAHEYYEYYKPFHSDMYIQTTEQENNLVILK